MQPIHRSFFLHRIALRLSFIQLCLFHSISLLLMYIKIYHINLSRKLSFHIQAHTTYRTPDVHFVCSYAFIDLPTSIVIFYWLLLPSFCCVYPILPILLHLSLLCPSHPMSSILSYLSHLSYPVYLLYPASFAQ